MSTSIQVISPSTQKLLFEVPTLTKDQVNEAVQKSVIAFSQWKKVPVPARVSIMKNFCLLFEQKKDKIAASITSQMGRPIRYSQGEVKGVLERANYMISVAEECLKDEMIESIPGVIKRFQRKEPLGPVFLIAAWNYPYLTTVNNIIPALLAGNTVLLKQSPQTPQCADIFVETLREAGIPHDVVQAIHVQDTEANYLVQHPSIQFVNFTGSVAVGKKIRQAIGDSQHLIGSAMELGGKDPAYVLPDTDLDFAVENIVDGAFFNSGQCCCSIERCYVHESIYDQFVEKSVKIAKNYILGDPNDSKTTLGPMANIKFANTVRHHIQDAIDKNAKALINTKEEFPNDKEGTAYVSPQILVDVNHDMLVMKEETFGPVLTIMKVSSDEEAVHLMNDSQYGLTASIWTSDVEKAIEIGDQIETGTWFMNRCDYIDPALAWVGTKESGLGFSMSKQGFNQYTSMGIPKFFRWISERYPMCSQLITDNSIPEFDNLYLDMNGIIHNCSHNNNTNAHFRITEEQIWIGVFNYIDHLFSKIKPKKLFFLAIDGVAPRAKMNQQRSRRFRTARDAETLKQKALERGEELPEEEAFDSNCITPGTQFMKRLSLELRYFISKKVTEDANWRNVEIVLSGPEVPGEGEHKIMEYIRLTKSQPDYNPNTRHCLYGLDADLIMLGLLSHDPHFALLREEVVFGKKGQKRKQNLDNQNFYLMHLSLMREYMNLEFNSISNSLSFPYDFERILDDFILLALFIGNDFLPNLPNLHVNEGALGLVFRVYKDVLPTFEGYIQDGGRVDMSRLQKVLDGISEVAEKEAFELELVDSLYLAGKRENGQTERQLLHELEKKKAKEGKLVMTDRQEIIFRQVNNYLLSEKPGKGTTLHFDMPFRARDKRFLIKLAQELNITCHIDYDETDKSTYVELSFDSDDSDDDNEESEVDEEAIAARDRVLKKYENAEIISDNLTKEEIEREEKEKYEAGLKEWKANYYKEKMNIDYNDQKEIDAIVGAYVVGIQWVLKYYYEGVASWGWFYPYHFAPKISDLKNITRFQDYEFTIGEPFKPFEQLMGVLPSLSRKLLPAAYQDLMVDANSPIIDFYPRDFELDMNGKKQDWEAVVKIPFIDENRLLAAMKNREHRLTREEKSMSQFGPSYKYTFDKELAKKDPENLPVYPSPLPGVFPDIHNCLAREDIFNLPNLSDNDLKLRKGLLPGAKVGKDALAGFPSLQTIPFSHEIKHHAVHVFQQDSRNESMIISIKNKYQHANIEEIAKLFLYRSIYVHYPYLKEAVVIGVSDAEKKYYVSFRHGKKQILEHYWDEKERESWETRMGRAEYLPSKRFGLLVGEINIGFHVCVLNGMHQTEEGALVKEFVNPSLEDLVPIQTVVIKVNNPDPRFIEKPAPPVHKAFPLKSTIFFLGSKFLGTQATVVGHSHHNVDIEMTIPVDERFQYEPEFGHEWVQKQEHDIHYEPSNNVARELNLTPLALSKLTSSLTINDNSGQRINVGLNLKFDARGEKVLGYTRKHPNGYWEYSDAAIRLIREYCEKFPNFINLLKTQKGNGMLSIEDFGWTTEGTNELRQMKEFVKQKGADNLIRASLETEELEAPYCHEIEKAAIQYHEMYEELDIKKCIIRGVPRKVLLKPADAGMRLNYQTFSLGDRVIYVCDSGAVPLGNKGTVVGVQEKAVDVIFDTTFMGGSTLGDRQIFNIESLNRCSNFRGATLPYSSLLNISNPSHQNTFKGTNNSTSTRNSNNHDSGHGGRGGGSSSSNGSNNRGFRGGRGRGGFRGRGRGNTDYRS
ncbi:exoribonuclease 1 [Cokeromyces recurvatus]|uniref:exoribonuclease 1 n=1 Tax=Cokeromyces recurvatus TaxID=90255 RepID=UPI0022204CE8|nr:exoribonuclease 1 [Cokeromyces recurvatus]KAI7907128.1 exoribonuclease 1 [Cokeromyces recurvatus]